MQSSGLWQVQLQCFAIAHTNKMSSSLAKKKTRPHGLHQAEIPPHSGYVNESHETSTCSTAVGSTRTSADVSMRPKPSCMPPTGEISAGTKACCRYPSGISSASKLLMWERTDRSMHAALCRCFSSLGGAKAVSTSGSVNSRRWKADFDAMHD